MKRTLALLLALLLLAGCSQNNGGGGQGSTPVETAHIQNGTQRPLTDIKTLVEPAGIRPDMPELSQGERDAYNSAADRLSSALLKKENSAATPLSLYIALSMLASGSQGETSQQLRGLLGLETDGLSALNQKLLQINNTDVIKTVNSMWVQPGWPVQLDYMELLRNSYYAWINEADFAGSAGDDIAGWIAGQTDGMIKPEFDLPEDTVMALVNATLLQDEWVDNFQKDDTIQQAFHAPGGDAQVDMMKHDMLGVSTWGGDSYRAISLPLKYTNIMFLLPDEGVDPYDLLQERGLSSLFNLDASTEPQYHQLEIGIPKFDIQGGGSAADALKAMGITRAFDKNKAEFEPISSEPVWVGDVLHGTRVVVHEDGVAAAGYTMVAMAGAAAEQPELQQPFILDRPFLFCISNRGLPVFTGAVYRPGEAGSVVAPGPKMVDGVPEKDKQAIEKTVEDYFRMLSQLDADMKTGDYTGKLSQIYPESRAMDELGFILRDERLLSDQQTINVMKAAYFSVDGNAEPAMPAFAVEFGGLDYRQEEAAQKVALEKGNMQGEATLTLQRPVGYEDWYITGLDIPQELMGVVEREYYALKAEYLAGRPEEYDMEALRDYVLEKFGKAHNLL